MTLTPPTASQLEEILRDLPRHGELVKDRPYRQVWRFGVGGRGHYLKFYPKKAGGLKRLVRGSPAMAEFLRLQQLQRANVPAPRPVSVLLGMRVGARVGDGVVIEGLDPGVELDRLLNECELNAENVPDRASISRQVIEIVRRLGAAGLGHSDLHLGNFLLHEGKLYLVDGYSVHRGGLKLQDVMALGQGAARFATRTELYRGWLRLAGDRPMPTKLPGARRYLRKFHERTRKENQWFGKIKIGDWRGHYFKASKHPCRWSRASREKISAADWTAPIETLLNDMEAGKLAVLKTSPSGDVWAAEINLRGERFAVVVKRPYKRYWYRYINEIGRGSRSLRAWGKAWRLIARQIPTAWPLLVMQRRKWGYVTDSVIVFERIPGPMLAGADLDAMAAGDRENLFRRVGRILRQIDGRGLSHFDAKSTNWIVADDPKLGPTPILIDVDGVRTRRWPLLGIQRVLRSMRAHAQYTPADSLALCRGYAPFSSIGLERDPAETGQ